MSGKRTLDQCVVSLIVEINSRRVRNERSPEVAEHRRGYQEALTGLSNSSEMSDVLDSLRELGWEPPTSYWREPSKQQAASSSAAQEGEG